MSTRGKPVLSLALACAVMLLWAGAARAAYMRDVPQSLTQPDGTPLQLLASGDEYYNWLHDERGFVIVRHPETGWLEYAVKVNGRLEPSGVVVGRDDPEAAGLEPGLLPDPGLLPHPGELLPRRRLPQVGGAAAAAAFSAIKNLVVFIRFSDQAEFTDPVGFYDGIFNASASGAVSMYAYYREASYQKLSVQSSFYPTPSGGVVVSNRDAQPRSYYMPYNAGTNPGGYPTGDNTERARREHTLLANAINAVSGQIPAGLEVDNNGDGLVDNVVFVVRGQPTAWNTILWPHQWNMSSFYPVSAYINNKLVQDYNFQLEGNGSGQKLVVGVLCHELAHTLGGAGPLSLRHLLVGAGPPAGVQVGPHGVGPHAPPAPHGVHEAHVHGVDPRHPGDQPVRRLHPERPHEQLQQRVPDQLPQLVHRVLHGGVPA